jgi:polyisoprenoid-binding protein YceI
MLRLARLGLITVLLAPVPGTITAQAAAPAPPTWRVDAGHSELSFRIRHLMSRVSGTFREWSGTIQADPSDWSGASVEVSIKAASIDTRNDSRDTDLRSDKFFDVANHPTITFRSTKVEAIGTTLRITGELTIRGVTRPVVLEGAVLGVNEGQHPRAGFEASATINRLDYGVTYNRIVEGGGTLLGDDVQIDIAIEAVRQES